MDEIIPREFSTIATVNRVELGSALKRVAKLTTEKVKPVKLVFDPRDCSLEVTSERAIEGEVDVSVGCASVTGTPATIGANARFLLDAIKDAKGEWVEIGVNEMPKDKVKFGTPLRFNFPGEQGFTAIVMPLRIEW